MQYLRLINCSGGQGTVYTNIIDKFEIYDIYLANNKLKYSGAGLFIQSA
jgi:hypothetical protein